MKCPKCGYMSFDFNEICPKCQRNIISEREKMNHLPFKPDPPFLLASLLAHTGDSQVGMELSEAAIVAAAQETMPPPEEPTDLDMELEPAPSMDMKATLNCILPPLRRLRFPLKKLNLKRKNPRL